MAANGDRGTSVESESSKRPRLQRNRRDMEEHSESTIEDRKLSRHMAVNGSSSQQVDGGFKPGAIICVKVENFVTYEKAEFFPGPNLNMVIGPNGTGKSSLVCAICLGLGYSPRHLGRAGTVKEFVKHGKDIATIEIELQKRPEDRQNHFIRVQIRREQNSQKWWLNGRESTQKAIQGLMKVLSIQVDNLCQFLPQDRVVEFAGCTPVDLLHETLRAAAPTQMLEWQEELKGLYSARKVVHEDLASGNERLKNMEYRQQGLQADVDRLREREEIQKHAENLKCARVCVQYRECRANYMAAKERKKAATALLRRLERASGPSLAAVTAKEEYQAQIESALKARKKKLQDAERAADRAWLEIGEIDDRSRQINMSKEAELNGFETKKQEMGKIRQNITRLEASLKNKPVNEFNPVEWNTKIVSISSPWP
jgi:structural maintenance of chromosomes protein 5